MSRAEKISGKLPEPVPGLVIRYAYLWRSEAARGKEEGVKDRPCAIVLAAKRDRDRTTVVVAPITHSPPAGNKNAIEVPRLTKLRLGPDDAKSWIVTNDLDVFVWPGPDVRPIDQKRGIAYGHLPSVVTKALIVEVRRQAALRKKILVKRT
jgi:hypothetical protein